MQLKPGSWHYRLADIYGRGCFYRSTDLCSYATHFLLGVVLCCFIVALAVLFGAVMLVAPAVWAIVCIRELHLYAPDEMALTGLVLDGDATLVVLLGAWATYREDQNKPFLSIPAPIREAYRGWKERYCPVIEFVE